MYERPQIISLSAEKGGDEVNACGDPLVFGECGNDVYGCAGNTFCVIVGVYSLCFPIYLFNLTE